MNIIETKQLTKKFGSFTAVDHLDIQVQQGEIKAIVGENGAGKTTLMNMLFGMFPPTSGEILLRGESVHFRSPSDAINAGLGMVHQHFKLVPSMTVYENILLGDELSLHLGKDKGIKTPFVDSKEEIRVIRELIEKYNFGLDPEAVIKDISVGLRQRVEILKMLYRNAEVLILDEPTAVLTPQEVDELLENLKSLKELGKTIILITHKLGEVMAVSDSVTVIRGGKCVGNVLTKDTNEAQLANMMVGRDVVSAKNDGEGVTDNVMYEVDNISLVGPDGHQVLDDVSFKIHEGEILGVAGVEGNGQSELTAILSGMLISSSGTVKLKGKEITNVLPDKLRTEHVAIIPEDRYAQGLCREMTIGENSISGYFHQNDVCKNGFLNEKNIQKHRDGLIHEYDVRIADVEGNVSQLSGGNAQKLILARELSSNPDMIIASQPTRGVDVGSIEFIHKRLLDQKKEGKAILLISSELSEVMGLSDRIIVMYKGKIAGEVLRKDFNREKLGLIMAGINPND